MSVLHMDCVEGMRMFPDNTFDSIVTDPPYELGFMGKSWDSTGIAYSVELWREALRVLKPGGHLLAFSGSRTYHRMTCAIEDAGFDIRDQIMWVYGSGFPKSMDVGKAIDKARRRDYVLAAVALGLSIPGNNLHDWTKAEHAPGDKWWGEFKAVLSPEQWGAIEREVIGRDTKARSTSGNSALPAVGGETVYKSWDITAPATDAARQWEGWGTALKPAHEPICVARKPLIGTVAANVLAHGTGAINIDGCRVGDGAEAPGRWPANFIHDGSDEVVGLFPAQAGAAAAVSGTEPSAASTGQVTGERARVPGVFHADTGSAARFYYCAKASAKDRGEGNTHPTVKPSSLMQYLVRLVTPPGGTVLDPFTGSGSTYKAATEEGFDFIGFEMQAEYVAIANARGAA